MNPIQARAGFFQNLNIAQQQKRRQQALQQFAQQQGLQTPQGLSPQFLSQLVLNRQQQAERLQLAQAKPIAPKQSSSVITDPRDPNRAIRVRNTFDAQGNLINQQFIGEATLAERIGGVTAEGLQRGTQAKLEQKIEGVTL